MSDWNTPRTDRDNVACDGVSLTDRDAPVQSTGRNLSEFTYTWDGSFLYAFTARAASDNNIDKFIYYADTDNDGLNNLEDDDADGDGLDNWQEWLAARTSPWRADTDGDRSGDFGEWRVALTDPLDPLDNLHCVSVQRSGSNVIVRWASEFAVTNYWLDRSPPTNAPAWAPLAGPIGAAGPTTSATAWRPISSCPTWTTGKSSRVKPPQSASKPSSRAWRAKPSPTPSSMITPAISSNARAT